jgi:hypothetical protein
VNPAILIVVFHFLFDWILQTRVMAENKSKRPELLLGHMGIILAGTVILRAFIPTITFEAIIINVITHGVIDGTIWRAYAWKTRNNAQWWKDHNLFVKDSWFWRTLGTDQTLHLVIALYLFMP